jgi:hypothetical protein
MRRAHDSRAWCLVHRFPARYQPGSHHRHDFPQVYPPSRTVGLPESRSDLGATPRPFTLEARSLSAGLYLCNSRFNRHTLFPLQIRRAETLKSCFARICRYFLRRRSPQDLTCYRHSQERL